MANYPISRYKVLIHTTSLIAASISFTSYDEILVFPHLYTIRI